MYTTNDANNRMRNINNSSSTGNAGSSTFGASSLTLLKSFRSKLSTLDDSMSVASNAIEGAKSVVGTTSARWGWAKASLLNFGAFSKNNDNDAEKNSRQDPNALENSKSHSSSAPRIPPWQKLKTKPLPQLQSQSQSQPDDGSTNLPQTKKQPEAVSVKIIDLESEYHGLTVDIPLSLIPGSNQYKNKSSTSSSLSSSNTAATNQDNQSKKGVGSNESIFGDGIVMANQWPNFTSIPNEFNINLSSSSSSSAQNNMTTPVKKKNELNTPKWVSPRAFKSTFSSSKDKGYSSNKNNTNKNEEKEESEAENLGDTVDIPKDLTNLTHLHELAVVYCL